MPRQKTFYVYILTNPNSTVLYTGVTNNLERRVFEHKQKLMAGFTSKYNINKLVYFEVFEQALPTIAREKQIKGGSRQDKINLVKTINPSWNDLSEEWET